MRTPTTTFRAAIAAIAASCHLTPEENTDDVQELIAEMTGFHLRNGCDYPLYKYALRVYAQYMSSGKSAELSVLLSAAAIALLSAECKLKYSDIPVVDAFDLMAWDRESELPECVSPVLLAFEQRYVSGREPSEA